MDLKTLQREMVDWVEHNFPDAPWQQPLMGVSEEVGELNHALLKQWQGIRGSYDEHEIEAQDAVGDIVIFLACLCYKRGWRINDIVETTWADVKNRDWQANTDNGKV